MRHEKEKENGTQLFSHKPGLKKCCVSFASLYCVNPHVEGHVVHYSDADSAKSQEKDLSVNLARFLKPALFMSD